MIKLIFTGDFCSNDPHSIELSESIKSELQTSNINCINFEVPLPVGELISPNKLDLKQSFDSPSWIQESGFNMVSLANNHISDYGSTGLLATKNAFKKITTLGVGSWDEAYSVEIMTLNGIRIGFFSATSADFSSLKDEWTDKNLIGAAWINHKSVNEIISKAKDSCDCLIVISHGGIEYIDVPLPEWRDRYRELIDNGADAIIASHPHVPQGIEEYKGKPIFYSLGNFFFDNNNRNKHKYWDNGLLAVLELNEKNKSLAFRQIPIIKKGNIVEIDLSKEINSHLHFLSEILLDDEKYIKLVNKNVLELYGKYMGWFLSSLRMFEFSFSLKSILKNLKMILFSKRNEKATLHQIREESTRWLLIRALKLKSKSEI